jgi:hypothetical protein
MTKKPGPPKEFPDTILARLPAGSKAALTDALDYGESESKFVRDAILERIDHRRRARAKKQAGEPIDGT